MTTTIVTRSGKGSPLTNTELDANFTNLKTTADAALPAAGGTISGSLIITSDLEVRGTTTSIDSTTVEITDLNITLAKDATNNTQANGAGITIAGSNAELKYVSTGDKWTLNKNLSLADSIKLTFGNDGDLEIYHDGSNSIIADTGTGGLNIRGSDFVKLQTGDGAETMVFAQANGTVQLKFDNSTKLATTSTGIDVSGDVTATGHFIADTHFKSSDGNATLSATGGGGVYLRPDGSTSSTTQLYIQSGTGNAEFSGTISSGAITSSDKVQADYFKATSNIPSETSANTGYFDVFDGFTRIISKGADGSTLGGFSILQQASDSSPAATALSIDTSSNATFSGSISSGAITSTGSGTTSGTNSFLAKNSSNTELFKVRDDGVVLINHNYLYVSSAGGAYIQNALRVRGILTNDQGNNLSIGSGGSDIEFNSKNFTSVGTISSGAITSSGVVTANDYIDLNNDGNRGKIGYDSNNVFIASTSSVGSIIFKNNVTSSVAPQTDGDTLLTLADGGNATFSGTISSGAITASGTTTLSGLTVDGAAAVKHANSTEYSDALTWPAQSFDTLQVYNDNGGAIGDNHFASIHMRADGAGNAAARIILRNDDSGNGRLYFQMRSGSHTSETKPKMLITDDGHVTISDNATTFNERLFVDGNLRVEGVYKSGTTTIIDSSRNLTSIGTISSGAITSSGDLKITTPSFSSKNIIFTEGGTDVIGIKYSGNVSGNPLDIHNFQGSGTTLVRVAENGNVNIPNGSLMIGATTAPASKLHVEDNGNAAKAILFTNSSNGSGAYAGLKLRSDQTPTADSGLYLNSSGNTNYAGANQLMMYQYDANPLGFVTNNTLRMVVTGAGNVGIGVTNPAVPLDIHSNSSAEGIRVRGRSSDNIGQITLTDSGGTARNQIQGSATYLNIKTFPSSPIAFFTGGTERLRIDSSGFVIIGGTTAQGASAVTLTPGGSIITDGFVRPFTNAAYDLGDSSKKWKDLHLSGVANAAGFQSNQTTTGFGYINFGDTDDSNIGQIGYDHTDNYMRFQVNNTEKVRIDSSGNLLVGTTSAANSSAGFRAYSGGNGAFTIAGTTLSLNRLSSDGEILNFQKDTVTVGSIQVLNNNNLTIGGTVADHGGLQFGTHSITPMEAGVDSQGTIDLGTANAKFKDLHLSGSANIGTNILMSNSTTSAFMQVSTNILQFGTSSNDPVAFFANNLEVARFDSSGQVGIGETSVNGDAAVEISKVAPNTGVTTLRLTNAVNNKGQRIDFEDDNGDRAFTLAHDNGSNFSYIGNLVNEPFLFFTNNLERARLTAGGNLLIGKTADNDTSAGIRFQSNGGASINRSGGLSANVINTSSGFGLNVTAGGTATSGNWAFRIEDGGGNAFHHFFSDAIGIGTSSPTSFINTGNFFKPSSSGTAKFLTIDGGTSAANIMLQGNITGENPLGGIYWTSTNGQSDAHRQVAAIDVQIDDHSSATLDGGSLRFFTKPAGGGVQSPRMTLLANGNLIFGKTADNDTSAGIRFQSNGSASFIRDNNVALQINRLNAHGSLVEFRKDSSNIGRIGTASGDKLTLIGTNENLQLGANGSAVCNVSSGSVYPQTDNTVDIGFSSSLRFKNAHFSGTVNAATGSFTGKSLSGFAVATGALAAYESGAGIYTFTTGGVGFLSAHSSGSTFGELKLRGSFTSFCVGSAEKARLDTNGTLLIGGSTTGASGTTSFSASGAGQINFNASSTGGQCLLLRRVNHNGNAITFENADEDEVGSITMSSNATAYNTSSDARLKSNIEDADDSGETIDAIKVRQYDWKSTGNHQNHGMIAQELQKIVPEAVSGDAESEEMMGIDYSKLVPMLVKEIQSLRQRVAQLEE